MLKPEDLLQFKDLIDLKTVPKVLLEYLEYYVVADKNNGIGLSPPQLLKIAQDAASSSTNSSEAESINQSTNNSTNSDPGTSSTKIERRINFPSNSSKPQDGRLNKLCLNYFDLARKRVELFQLLYNLQVKMNLSFLYKIKILDKQKKRVEIWIKILPSDFATNSDISDALKEIANLFEEQKNQVSTSDAPSPFLVPAGCLIKMEVPSTVVSTANTIQIPTMNISIKSIEEIVTMKPAKCFSEMLKCHSSQLNLINELEFKFSSQNVYLRLEEYLKLFYLGLGGLCSTDLELNYKKNEGGNILLISKKQNESSEIELKVLLPLPLTKTTPAVETGATYNKAVVSKSIDNKGRETQLQIVEKEVTKSPSTSKVISTNCDNIPIVPMSDRMVQQIDMPLNSGSIQDPNCTSSLEKSLTPLIATRSTNTKEPVETTKATKVAPPKSTEATSKSAPAGLPSTPIQVALNIVSTPVVIPPKKIPPEVQQISSSQLQVVEKVKNSNTISKPPTILKFSPNFQWTKLEEENFTKFFQNLKKSLLIRIPIQYEILFVNPKNKFVQILFKIDTEVPAYIEKVKQKVDDWLQHKDVQKYKTSTKNNIPVQEKGPKSSGKSMVKDGSKLEPQKFMIPKSQWDFKLLKFSSSGSESVLMRHLKMRLLEFNVSLEKQESDSEVILIISEDPDSSSNVRLAWKRLKGFFRRCKSSIAANASKMLEANAHRRLNKNIDKRSTGQISHHDLRLGVKTQTKKNVDKVVHPRPLEDTIPTQPEKIIIDYATNFSSWAVALDKSGNSLENLIMILNELVKEDSVSVMKKPARDKNQMIQLHGDKMEDLLKAQETLKNYFSLKSNVKLNLNWCKKYEVESMGWSRMRREICSTTKFIRLLQEMMGDYCVMIKVYGEKNGRIPMLLKGYTEQLVLAAETALESRCQSNGLCGHRFQIIQLSSVQSISRAEADEVASRRYNERWFKDGRREEDEDKNSSSVHRGRTGNTYDRHRRANSSKDRQRYGSDMDPKERDKARPRNESEESKQESTIETKIRFLMDPLECHNSFSYCRSLDELKEELSRRINIFGARLETFELEGEGTPYAQLCISIAGVSSQVHTAKSWLLARFPSIKFDMTPNITRILPPLLWPHSANTSQRNRMEDQPRPRDPFHPRRKRFNSDRETNESPSGSHAHWERSPMKKINRLRSLLSPELDLFPNDSYEQEPTRGSSIYRLGLEGQRSPPFVHNDYERETRPMYEPQRFCETDEELHQGMRDYRGRHHDLHDPSHRRLPSGECIEDNSNYFRTSEQHPPRNLAPSHSPPSSYGHLNPVRRIHHGYNRPFDEPISDIWSSHIANDQPNYDFNPHQNQRQQQNPQPLIPANSVENWNRMDQQPSSSYSFNYEQNGQLLQYPVPTRVVVQDDRRVFLQTPDWPPDALGHHS